MKRGLLIGLCALLLAQVAFAGGILTNSNQSAQFIRMFSRGASTDIDAIYYNPAGLVHLPDGLTLGLYSQTISQTKIIENTFPLLNRNEFEGDVFVPVFPNAYAAYKTGNLALSLGFGPNAGGGSASFGSGLPSFEQQFAGLPAMLSQMGVPTTAYNADIEFDGSSIYYGIQAGVSYAINEAFSVSVGGRYVIAGNSYEGSISNVQINPTHPQVNPTGAMMSAAQFFNTIGDPLTASMVDDANVDAKESGSGITPIVGFNIRPNDQWNIGFRYEGPTELELETEVEVDETGTFTDGKTFRNDIPRIYALGVSYAPINGLTLSATGTYYFDKEADWEGRQESVKDDTWEAAAGAQYFITPSLAASVGYTRTEISVDDAFQSDLAHNLSSDTIGLGGKFLLNSQLAIDFGFAYSIYAPDTRDRVDAASGIAYTETYDRDNWDVAIGLSYTLK